MAESARTERDQGEAAAEVNAFFLEGLRRPPSPPDLLDGLTQGYSAGLVVGSLFAIAGTIVAVALTRVDKSQVEEASLALRAV